MTSYAQSLPLEAELQVIESLRARYENEGFTFTVHPNAAQIPAFLSSYRPDAIAQKPGKNVAIEVKLRQNSSTERALTSVRRLFDGHADWQFHVVFMGGDPLQWVMIPTAQPEMLRNSVNDVHVLMTQGHRRAAFIMAWSLLEAAFRSLDGEKTSRARMPATIVQTLAMNGYIKPDVERRLRALIDLRNRIVHGDLVVEPALEDIEVILAAVDKTLGRDASSIESSAEADNPETLKARQSFYPNLSSV